MELAGTQGDAGLFGGQKFTDYPNRGWIFLQGFLANLEVTRGKLMIIVHRTNVGASTGQRYMVAIRI